MIDWDVAISTGTRWARPGPQVSLAEARRTVSELRDLAGAVQQPVYEVTGMSAASDHSLGRIAVVDRPGWIRANVDGFRVVLEPLVEQLRERAPGGSAGSRPGSVMTAVGSRVTGIQAGLILAYLSSRVLGQYELFLPPETSPVDGEQPGRLTLVAPNIVMVERELGVDPRDFRRWVCLHEETHRLQFTAVTWLRDYVQGQMTEFLLASELDPAAILQRLRSAADAMAGAVRGGDGGSLIDAVATPRQREIMDRLTAVMTLVEGHGDYVDGRGRAASGALGRADQGAVQLQARIERPDRADDPPHSRHRPQDEAVRGGLQVRPHGRGRGRHGRLQQGLDVAGDPADQGGIRPPPGVGGAGRVRLLASMGPGVAVAEVRNAVRSCLSDLAAGDLVLVACSGGADSLALAAAAAFVAPRLGLRVGGVTVDHGLQPGSAERAASVAALLSKLGLDPVRSAAVTVAPSLAAGPEAAARVARYGALDEAAIYCGAAAILLGHTLDDQAETVLLGLARGSGGRSLAGMAARRGALPPAVAWRAPRDHQRRVRRTGPRTLAGPAQPRLPLRPGPGPPPGAARARGGPRAGRGRGPGPHREPVAHRRRMPRRPRVRRKRKAPRLRLGPGRARRGWLRALPAAIRTRVLRDAAIMAGCPARSPPGMSTGIDALVTGWRGQRWVDLPGGVRARRQAGKVWFTGSAPGGRAPAAGQAAGRQAIEEGLVRGWEVRWTKKTWGPT